MSNVNFSNLSSVSSIDGDAQLCVRLNNALSGADGFARIESTSFEKSLGVFTVVQSNSALWTTAYTSLSTKQDISSLSTDVAAAVRLDTLLPPTDNTTLNATTSAHGLLPKLGGGTTNFFRADGSWAAPSGGGGGGGHTDVQVFTTSGTWTKPAGAVSVDILLISGGAGGSSGQVGVTALSRAGGAGGGPGKYVAINGIAADTLTATVSVVVGAGGIGGASISTDNTSGERGTPGGSTSFHTWTATGGAIGASFNTSAGALASSCMFPFYTTFSSMMQSCGASGSAGATPTTLTLPFPTGGGGGGTISSGNTESNGGAGGGYNVATLVSQIYSGITTGGAAGVGSAVGTPTAGGNGSTVFSFCGTGGGGGGTARPTIGGGVSANGANGGNGGAYGGGGGGGAASSENGFASGAGGNGGDGIAIITTYFV